MMHAVKWFTGLAFILISFVSAHAQDYAAKVTVNSGNSFVVNKLNVKGDRLFREDGVSSISVSMVNQVEFRFSGVSLPMCETMFRSGDRKSLESILEQYVGSVIKFNDYFKTNLGDYLVWKLRTQYWNRTESKFVQTLGALRKLNDPAFADVAGMYFTMHLLDQGKLANAETVFSSVLNPEEVSVPMTEYIQGKIALGKDDPRQAMQHVARIIAFYGRDAEWMAPATVLEARIYQYLGQPIKAQAVANELMIAYPDTQWSVLGKQIQQESVGKSGG